MILAVPQIQFIVSERCCLLCWLVLLVMMHLVLCFSSVSGVLQFQFIDRVVDIPVL